MPELTTLDDYKREYLSERERLAKLWDAYEKQEKELAAMKEKLSTVERQMEEKDKRMKSLKDVLEARDRENRELEIEHNALKSDKETHEPKIRELASSLRIEKDRFAKLFALAEELDEELRQAKKEIEVRDEWFRVHVDVLTNVGKAIEERDRMIESVKRRGARVDAKAELGRMGGGPAGGSGGMARSP